MIPRHVEHPPAIRRVLETALYVDDLERARRFYETVLGLAVMVEGERLVAFDAGSGTVLLLFRRGTPPGEAGRDQEAIPAHDGQGQVHFALAVDPEALAAWRDYLTGRSVRIESERQWPRGGTSIYFRDPDAHLVELATPGVWESY